MKQEIIGSISTALNTLGGVSVHGRENVYRMSDVFRILEGVAQYVSQLPDEVEEESE